MHVLLQGTSTVAQQLQADGQFLEPAMQVLTMHTIFCSTAANGRFAHHEQQAAEALLYLYCPNSLPREWLLKKLRMSCRQRERRCCAGLQPCWT